MGDFRRGLVCALSGRLSRSLGESWAPANDAWDTVGDSGAKSAREHLDLVPSECGSDRWALVSRRMAPKVLTTLDFMMFTTVLSSEASPAFSFASTLMSAILGTRPSMSVSMKLNTRRNFLSSTRLVSFTFTRLAHTFPNRGMRAATRTMRVRRFRRVALEEREAMRSNRARREERPATKAWLLSKTALKSQVSGSNEISAITSSQK
mmetsp:Transcript_112956/g.269199  ORF Transcript_112956/g.269199 Transcript_112956/m.269199 type:complete len:207 (+) Transcript_112956:2003-2623(+)